MTIPTRTTPRTTWIAWGLGLVSACLVLCFAQSTWAKRALGSSFTGNDLWGGVPQGLGIASLLFLTVWGTMARQGRRIVAALVMLMASVLAVLGLVPRSPTGMADDMDTEAMMNRSGRIRHETGYMLTGMNGAYVAADLVMLLMTLYLLMKPGDRTPRTLMMIANRKPGETWALIDRGADPSQDL